VLGVSPLVFLRAIAGVFQAAAGMFVVLALARPALVDAGLSPAARLTLLVVLGAAIYLPLCAWRAPEVLRDGRALLPRRPMRDVAPVPRVAET
jgi:heme A synthase